MPCYNLDSLIFSIPTIWESSGFQAVGEKTMDVCVGSVTEAPAQEGGFWNRLFHLNRGMIYSRNPGHIHVQRAAEVTSRHVAEERVNLKKGFLNRLFH
jgi:hypothetical protein